VPRMDVRWQVLQESGCGGYALDGADGADGADAADATDVADAADDRS
jgi:hypothetical protein